MKKTFAVIAAVLFVLSFAASAFAIHAEIPAETQAVVAKGGIQITLGGEIRTRGWYTKNLGTATVSHEDAFFHADSFTTGFVNNVFMDNIPVANFFDTHTATRTFGSVGVKTTSGAWYDQRVRLYVDAKVSDNVQGYVMLETGTADQLGAGDYLTSNADKYKWGNLNAKPNTSIGILEAWILYTGKGLFGFNSGLKIGHMPLKLGHGYFFDHTQLGDDAIVFFMDPVKQMHIGLLAVKFYGDAGSPVSVPLLGLNTKPATTGSIYDNTDDLDGYVGLMTYKINDKNTVGINYTYLNLSDLQFSHQNLGLHADGSFGNFGYAAEVDFQFGKVFSGTSSEAKFGGKAVYLKGYYNMNPLKFTGQFGWGSGDNDSDNKIKTFIPYVGALQNVGGAFIYDYLAAGTTGFTKAGIANTTFVNLGIDYAATKELSFAANFFNFWASKTTHDVSENAGWEVDGKMVYKIAKNLTYQFDIGYFKPGSYYEDTFAQAARDLSVPSNGGSFVSHVNYKSPDTAGITAIRHALTLSF